MERASYPTRSRRSTLVRLNPSAENRAIVPALLAVGAASCAHAVWLAGANPGIPEGDAAHYRALALEMLALAHRAEWASVLSLTTTVVPNPGVLSAWLALVQGIFGSGERVCVAAWLPFHLILAVGLWRGGQAVGGRAAGVFAVATGLFSPVVVHAARSSLFDFPLVACVGFVVGNLLNRRMRWAGVGAGLALWTRLAAGPMLAVPMLDALREASWRGRATLFLVPAAFFLALYPWHAADLWAYSHAGGNVPTALQGGAGVAGRAAIYLRACFVVVQPPVLLGLVAALLSGGSLRLLAWAVGMVLALLPLTVNPQARYLLPLVPVLTLGVASMGARWSRVLPLLSLATLGQTLAYDLDVSGAIVGAPTWLRTPPATPDFPIDASLDWLSAHSGVEGAPAAVVVDVQDWPGISFAALRYRALERGLSLRFIAVDGSRLPPDASLGVVIRRSAREPGPNEFVRLLTPTATLDAPDGFTVELYDYEMMGD